MRLWIGAMTFLVCVQVTSARPVCQHVKDRPTRFAIASVAYLYKINMGELCWKLEASAVTELENSELKVRLDFRNDAKCDVWLVTNENQSKFNFLESDCQGF